MSIGHIQDESGELFGRSLRQHCFNNLGGHHVNTLAGHCVNILGGGRVNTFGGAQINTVGGARINILEGVPVTIGIIRMSSGQHLCDEDVFEATLLQVNRWPANQIDIQYGICIVDKKWASNRPRILGRCRQIETRRVCDGCSTTVCWVQDLGNPRDWLWQ
jgi:hypothetical protein